jgi:SAM-dependent methyltransferase
MPIDHKVGSSFIFQRDQYRKWGIGRYYWDYRDNSAFKFIKKQYYDILDIGCGEGLTLEKLLLRFPHRNINGIDIIKQNVDICKQHNLPVSLGSVYDLPLKPDSIDLCLLLEVIEHLENPALALKNIRRILRPGGQLVIIFPNDFIFKAARLFFLKFKEAFADLGHINHFSPKSIKTILSLNGFEPLEKKNIPFYFWPISLHCVVLAKKS